MVNPASRYVAFKLLFMAPMALMAGLGTHSRLKSDNFEQVGFSYTQQKRITAYREPVIAAQDVLRKKERDPKALIQTADLWLEAYQQGRLYPLVPATTDDGDQESVRGEVIIAAANLSGAMTFGGKLEAQKGHTRLAKDLALEAIQLGEILKYSDLSSLNVFRVQQARSLALLNTLSIEDRATRAQVALSLSTLGSAQKQLDAIVGAARLHYQQADQLESDRTEALQPTPKWFAQKKEHGAQLKLVSELGAIPELESRVRIAEVSQKQFQASLQASATRWLEPASPKQ